MNTIRNTMLAATAVLALGAFATGSALAAPTLNGQGIYDVHNHLVGFDTSAATDIGQVRADASGAAYNTVPPAVGPTQIGVYDVHGSLIGYTIVNQ